VTLVALALEAFALVSALAGGSLAAAAAAHALAALAAAIGLGGSRRDERFFIGALALALPVGGLAGLVAIRVWNWLVPADDTSPVHASLETLPTPERPREPIDAVFGWIQAELAVQPLGDVIRGGDPESQRWAIGLLERRGDAAAIALLREALQAPARQTQSFASNAIRRVEERLMRDVERARHTAQANPSPTAWTALGHACRVFAGSGLADDALRVRWLGDAAAAYTGALATVPADRSAALGLARVRLEQERAAEAEAIARGAAAKGASRETDLILAEALFAQGRWSELVAACRAATAAGREQELVTWWARA
jgi:hypothetical protein